jgi:hypothetical protein
VKIVDEFGSDDPLPPSSMCKTVRRGAGGEDEIEENGGNSRKHGREVLTLYK